MQKTDFELHSSTWNYLKFHLKFAQLRNRYFDWQVHAILLLANVTSVYLFSLSLAVMEQEAEYTLDWAKDFHRSDTKGR